MSEIAIYEKEPHPTEIPLEKPMAVKMLAGLLIMITSSMTAPVAVGAQDPASAATGIAPATEREPTGPPVHSIGPDVEVELLTPASGHDPLAVETGLQLSAEDKRMIEQGLRNLGFDPGQPDGQFDMRTRAAIRGWQARRGDSVSGYLNQAQAASLRATGQLATPPAPQPRPVWLEPPPFLEATELFWTVERRTKGEHTFPYKLEGDIFPHFILANGSRCRNLSSLRARDSWTKPCVSVTPAIRLRMLRNEDSAPVQAPSFMPRVNLQWLGYLFESVSNLYIQIGHHSNGQSGCLFVEETGQDRSAVCSKDYIDVREQLKAGKIKADDRRGNFSLNYIRLGAEIARRANAGISWRVGMGIEARPDILTFDPLDPLLPGWRGRIKLGIGHSDPKPTVRRLKCRRFDVFADIGFASTPDPELYKPNSFAMQATCLWSEARGVGVFVRYYHSQDYYNASFLSHRSRLNFGVTINRLKAFGIG